ncbi:GyrI-like domain-containing protein [Enterovirga rhinocerotis]|uniref:Effector-binding domain-containing protein n=1 Tax=Enterovirga rhinocerotis TaxID=1339210 RepID=A0A4R7BWU4_9HYPH|nr:GyrI-like domain-containing protein [Enterovirga rhinocerotis]TDR90380.1 effector-binding domain-containing protein [Enterovirga rhinocerotis]
MRAASRSIAVALTAALLAPALPLLGAGPLLAQGSATGSQPPAAPAPASPPADSPGVPAAPTKPSRPPLLAEPGDPANVDDVVLPAKPALVLSGSSDWDSGLKSLKEAFGRIEKELGRLGIEPRGRPIVLYTQTTDDNFRFEAMIPVAEAPANPPADLAKDMRFGTTPAGRAWRFVHKGPYDDVDNTYETITTYLEAKDIVAKDAFIEEFATDPVDGADADLEVNIFVQPR